MNAWRKMHASISSFMSFQGFGIVTAVFCSFYRSSGDLRVVATGSECGIWPYNCNFWFTVFLNTYLHVPESSRHPTREQRSSIVTGSLRDGLHHPCDRSDVRTAVLTTRRKMTPVLRGGFVQTAIAHPEPVGCGGYQCTSTILSRQN